MSRNMVYTSEKGLTSEELREAVDHFYRDYGAGVRRVLLLPPDYTRMYSGAGQILAALRRRLAKEGIASDVMPALGTHVPMTAEECRTFFEGTVSPDELIAHNWRQDVVKIGEVPASFVRDVSDGLVQDAIDVEVNRRIVSGEYDLIVSIGQVVPHEVVGMANYSKNIFVGCGGSSMINSSHMLGAFYGMERIMGRDFSPVRQVFDYAQEHFLQQVPLVYILTVTTNTGDDVHIHGLFAGRERSLFEQAVAMSRKYNLIHLAKPIQKCVVYLDPREFKSTWLGNKAIYRTRMAMADGGELLILAPGIVRFGEDDENDRLIRRYGYVGRERVLQLVRENEDLRKNLSVAAHLIHGSSDGRFRITYATEQISGEEVKGVSFGWMPYRDAIAKYPPETLRDGWNRGAQGEEFFYVSNPALGLWDVSTEA